MRKRLLLAIAALPLLSCDSPDAVSKFCASATAALAASQPVFADMHLSCLRVIDMRQKLDAFQPPADKDTNCDLIGSSTKGAVVAAQVLSDYFSAINALASFSSAKAGSDAAGLVSQTAAVFGTKPAAKSAVSSIANFLVSTATDGFKRRQLEKDLPQVSANITNVTAGLVSVVQDVYIDELLSDEQKKLANRYKGFLLDNPGGTPEFRLALHDRWLAEEGALETRRNSAKCLIKALNSLSTGFAQLASNARTLKAKELPGLLEPFVSQVQTLIPQIQKGF